MIEWSRLLVTILPVGGTACVVVDMLGGAIEITYNYNTILMYSHIHELHA